ncbi:hypothetical protein DBV15_01048 [Temnothorax longispinosus]|uniref:Uncharacterized protein n=1 Tax=Temnothorax longispinosus TaxID=300112 RepID=A0A4S2JE99_9HYME|nr:hypothetical protein DBV15_01048 [Temnothorax longispinosus]
MNFREDSADGSSSNYTPNASARSLRPIITPKARYLQSLHGDCRHGFQRYLLPDIDNFLRTSNSRVASHSMGLRGKNGCKYLDLESDVLPYWPPIIPCQRNDGTEVRKSVTQCNQSTDLLRRIDLGRKQGRAKGKEGAKEAQTPDNLAPKTILTIKLLFDCKRRTAKFILYAPSAVFSSHDP